eukprot:TRINITY_DN1092_c0_g2_i1.p1 TRINITY_DN1092_c0_g2~~TRINITY_DN1092_c0_g2_i1.p1  ORF type:complete len:429 (-),score=118.81 TRINITY_DN1092_c0_g2_i1:68-1225(-)
MLSIRKSSGILDPAPSNLKDLPENEKDAIVPIPVAVAPSTDKPVAPTNWTKLLGAITVYCASGMALTIVNKLAIQSFNYPNLLLVIQNGVTVLLILGLNATPQFQGQVNPLKSETVKRWIFAVLLFMAMLLSSLLSLRYVTVVTLTVIRNATALVVAAADGVVLKVNISFMTVAALMGILLGSIVYGQTDINFHALGYAYLLLNVIATSTYQIYVKKLTELRLTAFGMVYYNNVLSIPLFLLLALLSGEAAGLRLMVEQTASIDWLTIGISSVLGFCLSLSAFMLNLLVTATSLMVINNLNKIAFIVLSELAYQSTLTRNSAAGTAIVLVSGALYSYVKVVPVDLGQFEQLRFKGLLILAFGLLTALCVWWNAQVSASGPAPEAQ